MPIDGITGSVDQAAQAAALAANQASSRSQTMDSEVFMKLLVTQLRNFSLQMRMAAANLVGKQVSYTDAASGKAVTGTATAVSYADSVPTVTVNGKEVNLDVISGISTAA
jgi:flagellar basal-body rod modification protein FlgD